MVDNIKRPTDVAYMMTEKKLFWINELNELYFANYSQLNFNKTKLLTFNHNARSLTVDWVERSLYYIQNERKGSSIFKLDLNKVFESSIETKRILSSTNTILQIQVSPFTR